MSEIDQYDYALPTELIAQTPLPQRADARMLVVRRADQSVDDSHIRDLPNLLQSGDCLVLNDTKVLPARLVGVREKTGGRWSGLFLRGGDHDTWMVIGKTRGKLKAGERIRLVDVDGRRRFAMTLLTKFEDGSWAVRPEEAGDLESLLNVVGRVPLPPYIRKGEMQDEDRQRYQTVFAERAGAVAAPTAGLHFSQVLLNTLKKKGVAIAKTTLHVGIGTFRPVQCERLEKHEMHSEWGCVDDAAVAEITKTKQRGNRVIAVGTTVVRVLETASQSGRLEAWRGETDLFIRPGFQFRTVDALITNFHLPKSTLLVLVRTFGGDELLKKAYAEAIEQRYRFFSYGDAMFIC